MSPVKSLLSRLGRGPQTLSDQIEELMERNRANPDPETERKLVRLRHRAFTELKQDNELAPLETDGKRQFEMSQGLPVVGPEDLDVETIRDAILTHGCLHVRGLLSEEQIEEFKAGIDETFAACAAQEARHAEAPEQNGQVEAANGAGIGLSPWYVPFKPMPPYTLGGGRNWNSRDRAIWAADSPRMMFKLTDAFERLGIRGMIEDYFGERPALSMNKTVLRRAQPTSSGADWHQDGAFLGEGIRSLNVWLSLSHCGKDAPGMDLVPRRLDGIIETGGEGANFHWSVSPADAEKAAGEAGIVRPLFGPGDVLLFDHLFLHRTASEPTMTQTRYAVESWFFAPSAYPEIQVPIVL